MDAQTLAQVQAEMDSLMRVRQQLRADERGLRARQNQLATQPQVNRTDLHGALQEYLPPHLMPGNVGGFNCVTWPFWFQVNFDFGTNPTITGGNVTNQIQNFQVTQESAILLLAVSRQANTYSTSGHLGPWSITIRDNQSSRQFNDQPIPIQMISTKAGLPTTLPVAMLFMPNAIVSCTLGNWLPAGVVQPTIGSGAQQFSFFGYRIRIEDQEKVLSSVFAPYAG
jgi:hypothetical protein